MQHPMDEPSPPARQRAVTRAPIAAWRAVVSLLRTAGRAVLSLLLATARVVSGMAVALWRRHGRAWWVGQTLLAPLNPVVGIPRGRRRWQRHALDAVIAVVLYAIGAAGLIDLADAGPYREMPQLLQLCAAAGALPVAVRWWRPAVAWLVVTAAIVVTSAIVMPAQLEVPFVATQAIAWVLCAYQLAARAGVTVAAGVWTWSLIGVAVVGGQAQAHRPQSPAVWVWSVLIVTLTVVFGANVNARQRVEAALEAEQQRSVREQAERARLEERSRIARELHDVVAHNMSVIAIQAEAAPLRAPDDATALTADLAGIRATALETLTEMRRVLGVLRTGDDAAATTPAPDLAQLDALVTRVRAVGARVDMTVRGTPRPVPAGVAVSAYRIVQESLSNALRHAAGAPVTVELTYDAAALKVRVVNDRPPAHRDGAPTPPAATPAATTGAAPAATATPPTASGDGARHGLVGMHERTAMLGGQLTAGPTPAGGFAVDVHLPLDAP